MSQVETLKRSVAASLEERKAAWDFEMSQLRELSLALEQMPEDLASRLLPVAESMDRLAQQTAQTLEMVRNEAKARSDATQREMDAQRALMDHARRLLAAQERDLVKTRKAMAAERQAWKRELDAARDRSNGLLWLVLAVSLVSPVVTVALWPWLSQALRSVGLLD